MRNQTHIPAVLIPAVVAATFMVAPLMAHAQASPPRAPSVWGDYLAGHHAEAMGDNTKALDFYNTALRKGLTGSADLHSRMYVLALTEGRLDSALKSLDRVQNMDGKAPLASLSRAVRALRDGDFQTAESLLTGDDAGISRILSPMLIAWARIGGKDLPGALAALAPQKDADNNTEPSPLLVLHRALINDLIGKGDEARDQFAQLRDSFGLSVRTAELSGQNLERLGRADEARKLYASLGDDAESQILIEGLDARLKDKKKPPLDIQSAQQGAAEALYGVAALMLSQNAWESAMALAHMAEDLRPGFSAANMVTAAALQQSGRRAEAIVLYQTVDAHSPLSWLARLHMADNLDRLARTDEAIELLKSMSRERETLSRPLIELGDLLRRNDRFAEAAEVYTQALARIAEPVESDWSLFYARGVSYEQSQQWPKAEADFLQALTLSPDQPAALNYLGYLWIDEGQHLKRALDMIAKAVEIRPRDGAIIDSLGWGYYRTGDFTTAVKHLERAVMLLPADPVLNDHLGDALWRVGRTREARFQWERALILQPSETLAKEIATKLKNGLPPVKP